MLNCEECLKHPDGFEECNFCNVTCFPIVEMSPQIREEVRDQICHSASELEHQAAPCRNNDQLNRRARAGGDGGAGPLCSHTALRTWKGRVAVGRVGGAAGGRRGGQELLAELGCKELVEGSGGQESLLWRDREGDIKARSRELRKKAELASPTLCLRLRV